MNDPSDRHDPFPGGELHGPEANRASAVLKVLLVGVGEREREALDAPLRLQGIDPVASDSCYETMKLLHHDPSFAVVILDAALPAMRSFALARLIRESECAQQTPMVVIVDPERTHAVSFAGQERAPVIVLSRPLDTDTAVGKFDSLLELARQRRLLSAEKAERSRLGAALRDSQLRYELVGAATRDAVYDWDLLTGSVYWNQAVCVEYGYPAAAMNSDYRWWCERIHPDDRRDILNQIDAFLSSHEMRWTGEYRFRKADGTYAYVFDRGYIVRDSDGKPIRIIGAMQDLTARKRAEEALRESEQHFRRGEERLERATRASHVGIWELDLQTTRIWRNEEHDHAFGYRHKVAEWTRDTFFAHLHPDDRERMRRVDTLALRGRDSFTNEFRVIWPDGSVHWMSASGKVHYDANHRPMKIVGTNQDITERKRIEEELREAVRARDEFLSVASHELKTPLTAIGLQAQIMKRSIARSGEASLPAGRISKLIEQLDRQVQRLTRVVDDMLDISRLATGKLTIHVERFDLTELTREVVERFAPQIAPLGANILVETPEPVPGCWDRFRIEQVLMNLLTNAARYGEGKPIGVSVRRVDAHAELRVRDYGRGIAAENQERIFQRFERIASQQEPGGLGLGLFIVRQILHLHGGSIRVESRLGHGAVFVVELPLAEPRR